MRGASLYIRINSSNVVTPKTGTRVGNAFVTITQIHVTTIPDSIRIQRTVTAAAVVFVVIVNTTPLGDIARFAGIIIIDPVVNLWMPRTCVHPARVSDPESFDKAQYARKTTPCPVSKLDNVHVRNTSLAVHVRNVRMVTLTFKMAIMMVVASVTATLTVQLEIQRVVIRRVDSVNVRRT